VGVWWRVCRAAIEGGGRYTTLAAPFLLLGTTQGRAAVEGGLPARRAAVEGGGRYTTLAAASLLLGTSEATPASCM